MDRLINIQTSLHHTLAHYSLAVAEVLASAMDSITSTFPSFRCDMNNHIMITSTSDAPQPSHSKDFVIKNQDSKKLGK